MATPLDDIVEIYDYEVANKAIDGGDGQDTLQLVGGGYFIFPQAESLTNFETIRGTNAEDHIILTDAQLSGVQKIDGGGSVWWLAYLDELVLKGVSINLAGKMITNIDHIRLGTNGAVVKVDDLDLALRINARSVVDDALVLETITLTDEQRFQLFGQGYDRITDASGLTAANAGPTMIGLNGDSTNIDAGQFVRLDASGNAAVSDDRGAIRGLRVMMLNDHEVNHGYERLLLTATDHVTFSADADRTVLVDGVVVGTYAGGQFGDSGLNFSFNSDATPERVTEILHALAYQNTANRLFDFDKRQAEITVTDYGGLETKALVHLVNPRGNNVLKGGSASDKLDGWSGNDKLYGGAGSDILNGGTGKDLLYGQTGHDVFVFNTKPSKSNLDKILDFSVKDDTIWLDNAVFKKLGKGAEAHPGKLNKFYLTTGDSAEDGNDYLVYDKKTGILSYDADGSGAKEAVTFAQLAKGLTLTADDFRII
jgi:Ca2+-binding RTX toxin-like protein